MSDAVVFVQEAIIKGEFSDWTEDDRILIFLTKSAKEKNWNDRVDSTKGTTVEGLESRLRALDLKPSVHPVDITELTDETDVMKLFTRLINFINEGDEIYFDITHAFRYFPFIALAIIFYAKIVKNTVLEEIYYGAFEVLGTIPDVKKLPVEERIAPVLRLSSLVDLLEWAIAIHNFNAYGDTSELRDLLKRERRSIFTNPEHSRDVKAQFTSLSDLVGLLSAITGDIRSAQGFDLLFRENYEHFRALHNTTESSIVPPLNPVLKSLGADFLRSRVADPFTGYNAVKWCSDHGLIQQGFTLLQETIITDFILLVLRMHDPNLSLDQIEKAVTSHDTYRRFVSFRINAWIKGNKNESFKDMSPELRAVFEVYDDSLQHVLSLFPREFFDLYKDISSSRNVLNHAGFNLDLLDLRKKQRSKRERLLKERLLDYLNRFLRFRASVISALDVL